MADNLKRIIYLSNEQCDELFENGQITVDGRTIIYDPNDIYLTPDKEKIIDIQVDGVSVIGEDGVAKINLSNYAKLTDLTLTDEDLNNIFAEEEENE